MLEVSMMFRALALLSFLIAIPLVAAPALADAKEAQETVDKATAALVSFTVDPGLSGFREYAAKAKGMLIIPALVKAGFIFGASGGGGVLVARGEGDAGWSNPAFYGMGSVTFGLQIGAEVSEIVLLVMTEKGLKSFLQSSAKLGADIGVAVGPVGAGAKAQTSDILAYSRSKGLYGGINVEGAVLDVQEDSNRDYYGAKASPADILIERKVSNDGAEALRAAAAKVGSAK
jgi:lipid-binding SYLF domain-containing protein